MAAIQAARSPGLRSGPPRMPGIRGVTGPPGLNRNTPIMPPGLMAQGLPVTSQGGVQGVMGRGGNFQALGESALSRLGRPPMPPTAPISMPTPGGAADGEGMNVPGAMGRPVGPLPPDPWSSSVDRAGGMADPAAMGAMESMNKPSLADLYAPRGASPVPPGAFNPPAGRSPYPPGLYGPPGPPGGGVMGASGPPASPPRRIRSVSMPSQEKPQPKPRRPIQGTEKPKR